MNNKVVPKKSFRCAIYTRVSTDAGLEQDFNSLDAQREASEAYIKSQAHEGWKLIRTAYDDGGFSGGSLVRPDLQRLLDDVKSGLVDIIVVYKVDRLTRSLADFAKLVELFDAHSVSFVSVTQSFNTTTSMGRLTLNVLLSFAQFEREVTGERIRDKVAASKKKGIWMGGSVPLGYRVQDRKLLIVPEEAETVKMIFQRYLALGSMLKLLEELRSKGIATKLRALATGRTIGGVPFTQGPMGYLLGNRIYLGEIVHQGQSYPGEHEPILDRDLFESVQNLRARNLVQHRAKQAASNALLLGRFFDDAGNVMSPTHSRKQGLRYRYYSSRALMEGRKSEAGTITRVSAEDIETRVIEALATARGSRAGQDTGVEEGRAMIQTMVARVVVTKDRLTIELSDAARENLGQSTLCVPWTPKPSKPKRDLVLPINSDNPAPRPMHAERRAKHLRAIALGRKWLQDLITGKANDAEAIAAREGRSARSVNMMISLAFVSPDIIEAAAAGRLPRGIGVTRLVDLPLSWAKQKTALGLPAKF
ncbi:MAG: recombinase family protein [Proteobacteria bacterium]|nr:recombinase family protein [Pseudomonadota bacterium]